MKLRVQTWLWPLAFGLVVLIVSGWFVRGQTNNYVAAESTFGAVAQTAQANAQQVNTQREIKPRGFGKFQNPLAIATDSKGRIYVLDARNPAVVQSFSQEGQELETRTLPALPENYSPNLLAVADDGSLIVAQSKRTNVFRILPGSAPEIIVKPENVLALAVYGNELWALGGQRAGLWRVGLQHGGTRKTSLSQIPSSDFSGLHIGKQNDFYAYAFADHLIWHYDENGKLIEKLGGGAPRPTQRGLPASHMSRYFGIDTDGAIYWTLGDDHGTLLQLTADRKTAIHYPSRELPYVSVIGKMGSIIGLALGDDYAFVIDGSRKRVTALPKVWSAVSAPNSEQLDMRGFGYEFRLQSNAPYKVFTTPQVPLQLRFEPGNRRLNRVQVVLRARDYWGNLAGETESTLEVTHNNPAQFDLPTLNLPKLGWYSVSAEVRAPDKQVLVRREQFICRTMADDDLPIPDKEHWGWDDLRTHRMVGMGLHRFSLHKYQQIDEFSGKIALARQMKVPYFILLIRPEDCTPEAVRHVVQKLESYGDDAPRIEIVNEPDLNMSAGAYIEILKRARDAAKQVNPRVQIIGPSQCGVRLDWLENFLRAGGGDLVDILSIHTYERHNSMDVAHWQKKFSQVKALLQKYSVNKPLFQTEHGYLGDYHDKMMRPQWQARMLTLEKNVLDRFGISSDEYFYYYVNEGGFTGFSAYIVDRNRELLPAALMTRTRAHFLKGKKYSRALNFGAIGNQLLIGNEYAGERGKLLILQNAGVLQDITVEFHGAIRGAAPKVYDCFGNEKPWSSNLKVGREPVYVVAPSGLTLDFQMAQSFGKNIAPQAKVLCDDPKAQANAPKLFNNLLEFDFHDEPERVGLLATDGKLPLHLTLEWDSPQKISRAILYASLADNDKSTPLEYEVLARQNGIWKKISNVQQKPSEGGFPIGTRRISDYDNPWIFLHDFAAPVTADALRFRFLRTTYGHYPTEDAAETLTPSLKQRVELRELQVFAP